MIDRVSVEPSRRCSKGCSFCYNGSNAEGEAGWTRDELVAFAVHCALDGILARTLTTNGILLDREPATLDGLELDPCDNGLVRALVRR